jgi:tRNA G26 N,N-dimethylase Trm1
MVKKGISSRAKKQITFAEKLNDLAECQHCGKKYSIKTAENNSNKCPYCNNIL